MFKFFEGLAMNYYVGNYLKRYDWKHTVLRMVTHDFLFV